jgi:glycosyltransferase involved in cell wall biosynthesis
MLSVTIITKNEEKNIERCLKSVQWASEIIVVDSFSSDSTVEYCRQLNATVIQREWEGYSKQKEFALLQAKNEWILSLDADEEVPEELAVEIQSIILRENETVGYEIPRKSFFLGKWMKHGGWYPGYQLRLFKKSKIEMNHRPVHEGFVAHGSVGRLACSINHYTYHSIHQYLEKMNDYTSLDVINKIGNGRTIYWYHFLLNPLATFLRMYISLSGWKDGFLGFLLAYYSSLYTLLVFTKSWEYQTAQKRMMVLPPVTTEAIVEIKKVQ